LEMVDKEIKRPHSWFSCEVLTSHLVKKWSTKKSRGFLFDYFVKSFLHTMLRNGRQRNQEGSSLIIM